MTESARRVRSQRAHVALLDPARREVLVGADGSLPTTTITWADPGTITTAAVAAAREVWGLDVAVLEAHGGGGAAVDEALLVLEVLADRPAAPVGGRWTPVDDVDPGVPRSLQPRLAQWSGEWRGTLDIPAQRPRWARPGFVTRARRWIDEQLTAAGRPPTGPAEQITHWGISCVMRVGTTAGPAWFKAVFPALRQEPGVTAMLDREQPGAVAPVLAVDEAEGWLLLDDVGSAAIVDHPEHDVETIRRLVGLQRAFIDRTDVLMTLGCPVRPFGRLAADLTVTFADPIVRAHADVTGERVATIVSWITDAAVDVAGLGFVDTLVHGDFHPRNAVVGAQGPIIFDWSDAAVAHPLVDTMTWSRWLHRDPERGERAWEVFLASWSDLVPATVVRAARHQLEGLAAGYHLVSYARILGGLEPATRPELQDGIGLYFEVLDRAVG